MNILEQIVRHKRTEVEQRRSLVGIAELVKKAGHVQKSLSLKQSLLDPQKTGILAEFKRKSPSKGVFNANADIVAITKGYAKNGASGLSVLTDEQFFGGSDADLREARMNNINTPILRKDFIIDEYQIAEARAMGADCILLIAACLSPAEVKALALFAKELELEVLLELHAEEELGHICEETELVGINNRDLKTFSVDIERSLRMAEKIPAGKIKIAESGISSVDNIALFRKHGFKGFLIGETFMKAPDPTIAFADFVNQLKAKAQ
jgi:indole-3-glycerol phosphate synthase